MSKIDQTPPGPALRICHLADIHLGYRRYNKLTKSGFNQREVDVNTAFRESIDRCIALKPDLVLIAGDLFHTVRPSNSVVVFCFREIRRLAKESGAPVVILAGNHDSPKRIDTGSALRLLGEIPGVYISDSKLESFDFPKLNLSVTCLPHLGLEEPIALRAKDSFAYNILMVHAQVDQRILSDFGGVDLDIKRLSPHEWDYIALGHVHIQHNVGLNAAYSGSIEYTGTNIWSEARENKGFLLIDFPSRKRTFHSLTSPRQIVLLDSLDCSGKSPAEVSSQVEEILESMPGGIDGKIVKLELINLTREAFRQLDHKALKKYRSQALNLMLDLKPPLRISGAQQAKQPFSGDLAGELEKFCKSWRSPSCNGDELVGVLNNYMKQVMQEDEAYKP